MRIYKDCDVRGVFGRELFADEVYRIGRRLTTMIPDKFLASDDARAWRFGSLGRVTDAMIRYGIRVGLDSSLVPRYKEIYGKFRVDVHKIYGVEV